MGLNLIFFKKTTINKMHEVTSLNITALLTRG